MVQTGLNWEGKVVDFVCGVLGVGWGIRELVKAVCLCVLVAW